VLSLLSTVAAVALHCSALPFSVALASCLFSPLLRSLSLSVSLSVFACLSAYLCFVVQERGRKAEGGMWWRRSESVLDWCHACDVKRRRRACQAIADPVTLRMCALFLFFLSCLFVLFLFRWLCRLLSLLCFTGGILPPVDCLLDWCFVGFAVPSGVCRAWNKPLKWM
jgi:hypothetical protein